MGISSLRPRAAGLRLASPDGRRPTFDRPWNVIGEDRREASFGFGGDLLGIGDDCELQRGRTWAIALARGRAWRRDAQDPLRHLGVGFQIAEDLLDAD